MGVTIGDAVLYIRGDNSKLQGSLNQTQGQVKTWGGKVSGMLKEQMTFAAGQFMATGLSQITEGLKNSMTDMLVTAQKYNEEISDLSRVTGATLEDSSRLYNVADDLRVSYGDLGSAMKLYAKYLADTGSQEKINTDTLAKLSEEYLRLPEGVARTNFVLERFGRNGVEMIKVLERGPDALREMAAGVEETLIVTEESAKATEAYRLALDDWEDSVKGIKIAFAKELLPYLIEFMQFLTTTAIPVMRELVQGFASLPGWVKWIIIGLGGLLIVIAQLAPSIMALLGLINMLGAGGALAGVTAFITGTVVPALGAFGAAIMAVGAPVWLLIAAIGVLIYTLVTLGPKAWETSKMLWTMFGALVKRLASDVGKWFSTVGVNIVKGIGAGISSGWSWLVKLVQSVATSLFNAAKAALGIHSPSKKFQWIGEMSAMGIDAGFTEALPKMAASMRLNLTSLAPAVAGGGSGRAVSVGHIEYHGSFSNDELNRLDRRSKRMAQNTLLEALG